MHVIKPKSRAAWQPDLLALWRFDLFIILCHYSIRVWSSLICFISQYSNKAIHMPKLQKPFSVSVRLFFPLLHWSCLRSHHFSLFNSAALLLHFTELKVRFLHPYAYSFCIKMVAAAWFPVLGFEFWSRIDILWSV